MIFSRRHSRSHWFLNIFIFFFWICLFTSTRSLSDPQSTLYTPTKTQLYVALRLHEAAASASSARNISVPCHQTRSIVYAFSRSFVVVRQRASCHASYPFVSCVHASHPSTNPNTPFLVPGVSSLSAAMQCNTCSLKGTRLTSRPSAA
jgi:hypothetical protein